MAKVFLDEFENVYTIGNSNTFVYGRSSNSNQKVILSKDISNIVLDANIDGLQLVEPQSIYQFSQTGNTLNLFNSNILVAQIDVQDDSDGTLLNFGDKNVTVKFVINPDGVRLDMGGTIISGTQNTANNSDTVAPQLASFFPADDSVDVPLNTNINLTFNEAIALGNGNVIINNTENDTRVIDIKDNSQIVISGKTITINPHLDFKSNSFYSIQMGKGVIKDLAGNDFSGVTDSSTFNFRTIDSISTGKVIDGYVSGATVFADTNGNGILDAGEVSTTTDSKGDFVLKNSLGTIVAFGGTDLTTGQPFKGVLKAPEGSTVVTPLTTVQQSFVDAGQTVTQAQTSVAKAFGFSNEINLLHYDPIAALTNATTEEKSQASNLMASNAKIVNFLVTASEVLQGAANNVNVTNQKSSNALLQSLVTAIKSDSDGVIDLADKNLVKTVLSSSVTTLAGTMTGDVANFQAKITKMEDTIANVIKDATDNISTVVNAGGTNTELLNKIGDVSRFTQKGVSDTLKSTASTLDPTASTANSTLSSVESSLTGKSADTSISASSPVVVTTPVVVPAPVPTPTPPVSEPSPSPSPAPATTFTVTNTAGTITFGGSATGTVTVTNNAGTLTFVRSGVTATTTVLLNAIVAGGLPAVTVSGTTSVADANLFDTASTQVITATLSDNATNLATLTGTGNAYSITVTGATATAPNLTTIDAATTVSVNAAGLTGITGTAAQIKAVADAKIANTITLAAGVTATVDVGSVAATDLTAIDGMTTTAVAASAVTEITGTAAQIKAVADAKLANTITLAADVTATIGAGIVAATDLTALDTMTTTNVVASGVTQVTGTAAEIAAVQSAVTITKPAGWIAQPTAGLMAATDLLAIDTNNSTNVDATLATVITGTATDVSTVLSSATIDTPANIAVTLTGSSAVADLNTIDTNNGTGIITATVTETDAATLKTLTTTGATNAYTITVADSPVAAADLNAIDLLTTVAVNATATSITGSIANVKTAIAASGITTTTNYAATFDEATVSVADLNIVDADTTGVITETVTEGDMATLAGLTGTGNAYTVTVTDASVSASALNTLDGKTTVNVVATTPTTITGSTADIATAISATTIDTGAAVTATVSSGTASAIDLNTIDANTSTAVGATAVTTITGLAADIKIAIAAAGITTSSTYAVTTTDATVSVADLNIIDADTTGFITATLATDTATNLNGLNANNNASYPNGNNNYAITINDVTVDSTILYSVAQKTANTVSARTATTINGAAVDIYNVVVEAVDMLPNYTATATSGNITYTQANTINADTTGVITATISNTYADDLIRLNTATGTNNAYTITVSGTTALDSTVSAANLNTINAATTALVTVTSTTISSSASQIMTAQAAARATPQEIALPTNYDVRVNSLTATASQVTNIDSYNGTGNVTAILSDGDISTLYSNLGTGAGNVTPNAYTITLTTNTASVSASQLNSVDSRTSVAIDATAVTEIYGSASDVATAINAATVANTITVAANTAFRATGANINEASTIFGLNNTGKTTVELLNSYMTGGTIAGGIRTGDVLDIDGDSFYSLTSLTATPAASANAVVINNAGWYFNSATKLFTWYDSYNQTTDSITLTGVTSVAVLGDLVTMTV